MNTRTISFGWWEAVVEIDDSDSVKMKLKEQLLFWMHGECMINDAEGDIEKAYLIMLGREIITESMQWDVEGIIRLFEEREGWYPLDGTHGVKLISVDHWEYPDYEFSVD